MSRRNPDCTKFREVSYRSHVISPNAQRLVLLIITVLSWFILLMLRDFSEFGAFRLTADIIRAIPY